VGEELPEERRLIEWLGARIPGARELALEDVRRPQGSGFSAETQIFTARFTRDGAEHRERYVLRRETPDPAVYPQQAPGLDVEIDIQYRVMAALRAHADVPVAPLLGYEADATLLGAPFFVMGFVDGVVPIENPLYTTQGFFVDAAPAERRTMVENGLEALAALHRLDHEAAGLGWLVPDGVRPGTARQLDVWEQYARRELGDRRHPLFEEAIAWLRADVPVDPSVGLCWGDPRPGNIIWRDFRPVCLTDFEAVSIASPDQDLGWWLMFDHWVHETFGVPRLEGEPTRDEQREIYARAAGRSIPSTQWHEIFAATRYAAIVVRVMNRTVARGHMPADQTVWLDNPATVCLEDLLSRVR
jgi:aminoglycoside phosphotransferase (APT) family kinase protein